MKDMSFRPRGLPALSEYMNLRLIRSMKNLISAIIQDKEQVHQMNQAAQVVQAQIQIQVQGQDQIQVKILNKKANLKQMSTKKKKIIVKI